jgi:hypothetical protein
MSKHHLPERLVILDIDGLRRDVFFQALADGKAPTLARLLGGPDARRGIHFEAVSNAPSITFPCQASLFTGAHPEQHRLLGNQFFDRFGTLNGGRPRFYAFDIGDTLAVDDAVAVYVGAAGLVNELLSLDVTTLYEVAARHGLSSAVAHNMIARGATHWLRPNLLDIARFTKGGGLIGLAAEQFDGQMIAALIAHLDSGQRPSVLTAYFMGLDHRSHREGPASQYDYLTRVVDGQITRLLDALAHRRLLANTLFALVSDHGQFAVLPDGVHSLRLSFPFDRELGHVFDALGLNVHDLPGEDPNVDAVVACNGGLAQVYLQHRAGVWADKPRFAEDVLPVGRAFWEATLTGQHAPALRDSLALILARNVACDGWEADYSALTPKGELVPIPDYLAAHPEIAAVDAVNRLRHLASPVSGDLVLLSNYAGGYYFGAPSKGIHGGLHPDDSECVLSLGWPDAAPAQVAALRLTAEHAVAERCRAEGHRRPGVVDLMTALNAVMGW